MQPGLSTLVFLPQRLHPGLLNALRDSGATILEVVAARHHFDYTDRAAVHDLAAWFHDTNTAATLHQPLYLTDRADTQWSRHVAPNLSLIDPEKSHRIAAMDEVKRALESAEQIPFRAITLHLGLKHDRWSPRALEHALTAIEHLQAFARPLNVQLLLENLQNEITTPEHLLEILRVGHFDQVGITLDLGHTRLPLPDAPAPGLETTLELLRPRIAQIDLHDNHATTDQHLWPTLPHPGSPLPTPPATDWPATLHLLDTLPTHLPSILEIAHTPTQSPAAITHQAQTIFSALTRRQECFVEAENIPNFVTKK